MSSILAKTAALAVNPIASLLLFIWRERPRLRNNPVILRELVSQLRRSSSFVQLGVFLGVALFFQCLIWNGMMQMMQIGLSQTDLSEYARWNFFFITIVSGIVLLLFVPLLSATAVNLERERDTWDLMASTPLSLGSILFGKLLSSILYIWLFFFVLLPFYGTLFPLGGVSPQEIAFFFYILSESVLVIAMIGLTCSLIFHKPVTSISMTYILGGVYLFGLFLIAAIWMDRMGGGWIGQSALALSPIFPIMMHLAPSDAPTFLAPWMVQNPYLWHGVMVTALLGLLALFCFYMLSRKSMGASGWFTRPTSGDAALPAALNQPRKGKPITIPDHRLILDGWNPVFVKEMRSLFQWPFFNLLGSIIMPMGFSLFILWIIVVEVSIGEEMRSFQYVSLMGAILLTPLFTIPYAASAFRGERDRGSWDMLAVTTLHPNRLARGKFFAGFHLFQLRFWSFFCVFTAAATIHFIFAMPDGARYFRSVLFAIITCYVCAAFYLSLGQWVSLAARNTVAAYFICIATAFIHLLGTIIIMQLLESFAALERYIFPKQESAFILQTLSPLYLLYNQIEPRLAWFNYDWLVAWLLQLGWMLGLAALFYWLSQRRMFRLSESREAT